MKLIEIKQYSTYLYVPKSKEDIRGDERKKYIKRLDLGYGIIDVESIVSVEPICNHDEETLETTIQCYVIYFKGNGTKIYTDIDGYNLISKFIYINKENSIDKYL